MQKKSRVASVINVGFRVLFEGLSKGYMFGYACGLQMDPGVRFWGEAAIILGSGPSKRG